MRCAPPLLLAAALVCGGCAAAPLGPDQQSVGGALPVAAQLPGGGWQVVGTSQKRPASAVVDNSLTSASGATFRCSGALRALAAVEPEPVHFARAVYRHGGQGETADTEQNLTVTVETASTAPTRAARITAATSACTSALTTKAGSVEVSMRLHPEKYTTPGAVGYSVTYLTQGLSEEFDYVVVTRGQTLVSASVTSPSGAANRRLLDTVVAGTADRVAARG